MKMFDGAQLPLVFIGQFQPMKFLLFAVLIALAFATVQKQLEIYPVDGSESYTKWVSADEIDTLMLRTDIKFRDVTGLTEIPQDKTVAFPDKPTQQSIVKALTAKVNESSLSAFMTGLTSNPHRQSRRAGSEKSIEWSVAQLDKIIKSLDADRQKLFKIELVEVRGYVAKSIIVTFKGTSDNYVIIGAHIDDVGHVQAGADDDGSGSVSIFEAFRVVATSNWVATKTVQFMWYTAEESGLIGSRQIAQQYKSSGKKVYAVLNHDMVGYQKPGEPLKAYMVIPQTNSALNTFTKKLVQEYSGIPVVDYRSGYGSDHASWNSAGYAASCWKEFYWSPQYHRADDKPLHISFKLIAEFTKVAIAFVVELSK